MKKNIYEEAAKKAAEEQQYVIAQLNKKLTDAIKAKDELHEKVEQGSQQAQGEVLELALEEILKIEFPLDEIIPFPKVLVALMLSKKFLIVLDEHVARLFGNLRKQKHGVTVGYKSSKTISAL